MEFNSTEVLDGWDLVNQLKDETDAILASTRSMFTSKRKESFRVGILKPANHSKAAKFNIYSDSSADEDNNTNRKTKRGTKKKRYSKKGRKVLGTLPSSDNIDSNKLPDLNNNKYANQENTHPNVIGIPDLLTQPIYGGSKVLKDKKNTLSSRLTLEIMDDASPDNSPRLQKTSVVDNINQSAKAESHIKELKFDAEIIRVAAKKDVFIPSAGSTLESLAQERNRLDIIQKNAQKNANKYQHNIDTWNNNLQKNESATRVQKLIRGIIGRKRSNLTRFMKGFEAESDWIEVRDRSSGESWYYNRMNGISQWNRPKELNEIVGNKSMTRTLPQVNDSKKKKQKEISITNVESIRFAQDAVPAEVPFENSITKKTLNSKSMNNISMNMSLAHTQVQPTVDKQVIDRELEDEYGTRDVVPRDLLHYPDGVFKPDLKRTVQDALLSTRFDTLSSVLSDSRWLDSEKGAFKHMNERKKGSLLRSKSAGAMNNNIITTHKKKDGSRRPMTAKFVPSGVPPKGLEPKKKLKARDMTIHKVNHPGYDEFLDDEVTVVDDDVDLDSDDDNQNPHILTSDGLDNGRNDRTGDQPICFGCWSCGGAKKCQLHTDPDEMVEPSKTMLLCRNWDLGIMRRRYRSEEIQEMFLKKSSSLKYDTKRKKFLTVVEARHIVYKLFQEKLHQCNVRMQLVEKGRRWARSLVDEVRALRVPNSRKAQATAKMLRLTRTLKYGMHVRAYTRSIRPFLPIGASTGYSWEERTKEIQYLFTIFEKSLKENVEIIKVLPYPKPMMLYRKKKFHLPTPRGIPIPKPSRIKDSQTGGISLVEHINYYMDTDNLGSWLEKLSRKISREVEQNAIVNVRELCPASGLESLRRIKTPEPTSIQFANLGRKPTPGMLARGGLPWELIVGELISTYIPPQYGNFMVMDKAVINPGIHPEENITFESLPMKPIPQAYYYRALEHPLVTRRAPTISICSHIAPDVKHYWCRNRPDQTGEIEPHGLRTSAWGTALFVFPKVDPLVFSPHETVATVNEPSANLSNCTHVDLSYPFCEPSTQDNSSLDYYHFLLQGIFSPNHTQIFTALTVQEPGEFLRGSNINGQLGHLIISVYRSWGFAQKTQLQEFKTDDGVPYWYNRESGQTYWEKPFLEEEQKCPLDGGTKLDRNHTEEPTSIVTGKEGYSHRYNQGEQRENMLHHVESTGEALRRRKKVAASAAIAREKLRELGEDLEDPSVTVHPPTIGGQPSIQMQNFGGSKGPSSFVHDGSLAESDHTRISTETSLLNNQGKKMKAIKAADGTNIMVPESEHDYGRHEINQHHGGDKGVTFVRGSALDGNSIESLQHHHNDHTHGHHKKHHQGHGNHSPEHGIGFTNHEHSQGNNFNNMNIMPSAEQSHLKSGIDMLASVENSEMIAKAVGSMLAHTDPENAPTEDIIQIGVNMGVTLMKQSASIRSATGQTTDTHTTTGPNFSTSSRLSHGKNIIPKNFDENYFPSITETDFDANGQMINPDKAIEHNNPHAQPIGLPKPNSDNLRFATVLDHGEQIKQENDHNNLADKSLTGMERAMESRVAPKMHVTDPPDVVKEKILHGEIAGSAEEATRYTIPVVLYPNLSTQVPGGAPNEVKTHKAAGDGTSFVTKEKAATMHLVNPGATGKPGDPVLRRATVPLPVGFFEKIVAKNIATQSVDYLPQIPNLPQTRTVGKVRPRSVSMDWLAIGFDPWSAGKKPLVAEFVSSLSSKAHEFFADQPALAQAKVDELRKDILKDEFINLEDTDGKNVIIKEVNTQQQLYNDFQKIASLVRHAKFDEVCELIEQPDWNCPIDYQDESGNTLLHVCCQNGNKRLVKLCVARGADVNLANIHGQTPMHFAYGYGYESVGEYLLKIGADDSLVNVDGLTPYEGLGMKDLSQL